MSFLSRIKSKVYSSKYLLFFFVILLLINLINAVHNSFPDEFDNILGGFYINQGLIPYKDFFSHHGLVSYYFASIITIITKQSFIYFRLLYSVLTFIYFISLYKIFRKYLDKELALVFLIFLSILGIASTYFWGQMLLADNLSAFLILPAYILLIAKLISKSKISLVDIAIVAIFSCLTFFTSITFTYLVIFINFVLLTAYLAQNKNKLSPSGIIKMIIILGAPYIFMLSYFVVSGSLSEFYQQNISYNKNTYIYNYPRPEGSTRFNPARYAIVIGYNFYNNYRSLLVQAKDFNLSYPFNITLALVNTILILYLIVTRRYLAAFFILTMLIFSNARSNPLNSKETDFQSAVYITLSLFNLPLIVNILVKELNRNQVYPLKLIYSFAVLLLGSYSFFFVLFIGHKFLDKAYGKFMGFEPMIYDRPFIAPLINKLTDKNDFVWIGPLGFEELLYIDAKQPSKYHWFLRAHSETETIKKELIEDLQRNKPKIVVYKQDFSAFGNNPNSLNTMLMNFLKENYFQIGENSTPSIPYKTSFKEGNYIMAEDFYFNKENEGDLINKLKEFNVIQSE